MYIWMPSVKLILHKICLQLCYFWMPNINWPLQQEHLGLFCYTADTLLQLSLFPQLVAVVSSLVAMLRLVHGVHPSRPQDGGCEDHSYSCLLGCAGSSGVPWTLQTSYQRRQVNWSCHSALLEYFPQGFSTSTLYVCFTMSSKDTQNGKYISPGYLCVRYFLGFLSYNETLH